MFADFIKGMSVLMFICLVLAGLNLGAPVWFYFAAFPAAPVITFSITILFGWIAMTLEDRARARRRAKARKSSVSTTN